MPLGGIVVWLFPPFCISLFKPSCLCLKKPNMTRAQSASSLSKLHQKPGPYIHQLPSPLSITTTMKRKDNKVVYIRRSTKAELPHQVIYDALDLPHEPGRTVKTVL